MNHPRVCLGSHNSQTRQKVDVYRRVGDRDATGVTIEIWPIWDVVHRETFVTVWETTFPP